MTRRGVSRVVVLAVALSAACGSETDPTGGTVPTVDSDPIGALALVPRPVEVTGDEGHLHLGSTTRLVASPGAEPVRELLGQLLRAPTGFAFEPADTARDGDIVLRLEPDADDLASFEAYELVIDRTGVRARARSAAGLFYASQTLRQLLPVEIEARSRVDGPWRVPMVTIRDRPRFEWRGAMLDVARHFFGPEEVRRLIDLLSLHKMNRLHLHLTDDQGWRIEVESWPLLTSVGGATEVGGGPGGFFTRSEYAELVEYADDRFITIVPEIDMPGHTNAALASYGELNESGMPAEPYTGVGVGFSSLWVDGPATRRFVEDVVGEVSSLTTGQYFHIGADEAMATSRDDYESFVRMARDIVLDQGKTPIGWDEIGTLGLEPPVVAQYWFSESRARAASEAGAELIASPAAHAYLDMKYDDATPIGLAWAGFVDVERAYSWDPVLDGLSDEDVLGLEAPLWTETVETREHIDLLMFPRLCGHADIAWSPAEGRGFEEYRERLALHGRRLDALGVAYHRSPLVDWK